MLALSLFTIFGLSIYRDALLSPPDHHECFQIVKLSSKLSLSGKQKEEIKTKLTERCSKLKTQRQQVCTNIVNTKLDEILTMIHDQKNPHFICNAVGFRHPINQEAKISLDDCTKIVEKFKVQFQNFQPRRRPQLNRTRPVITAQVLEDTTNTTSKAASSSTNSTRTFDRPFGIRPENGVRNSRFRLGRSPFAFVPICKELSAENRIACHVISRFVFKNYMKKLNQTASEVCTHLNKTNYIRLL